MSIVYQPEPRHRHELPQGVRGDIRRYDLIGTIVHCECGRHFICKTAEVYGWAQWKPVRWWNFAARKRIAAAEEG